MRSSTDRVGELSFDQRLINRLRGLADTITNIGDLQCIKYVEQGRLVQGHRMAPLYENFGRFRRASCDGLFHVLRHAVKAGELHQTWGRDRRRAPDRPGALLHARLVHQSPRQPRYRTALAVISSSGPPDSLAGRGSGQRGRPSRRAPGRWRGTGSTGAPPRRAARWLPAWSVQRPAWRSW